MSTTPPAEPPDRPPPRFPSGPVGRGGVGPAQPITSFEWPTPGPVIEERQPHMRGGAHEPLSRGDIEGKFLLNARHGGYDAARAQMALKLASNVVGGRIDLSVLRG